MCNLRFEGMWRFFWMTLGPGAGYQRDDVPDGIFAGERPNEAPVRYWIRLIVKELSICRMGIREWMYILCQAWPPLKVFRQSSVEGGLGHLLPLVYKEVRGKLPVGGDPAVDELEAAQVREQIKDSAKALEETTAAMVEEKRRKDEQLAREAQTASAADHAASIACHGRT